MNKYDEKYYYSNDNISKQQNRRIEFICKKCKNICKKVGGIKEFVDKKRPLLCNSCINSEASKFRHQTIKENGNWDNWCKKVSNAGRKNLKKRWSENREEMLVSASDAGKKSYIINKDKNTKFYKQIFTEDKWKEIKKDPILYKKWEEHLTKISRETWASYTDEEKEKRLKKSFKENNFRSKRSDIFKEWLIENNLYNGFKSEQWNSGYQVDEMDRNRKIIIEFYGDIYHCNPLQFKNENIFCKWIGRTVKEQWERDRIRIQKLKKAGFKIIIIWESEFFGKNKDIEKIKRRLINEIS